jgi:sortase A
MVRFPFFFSPDQDDEEQELLQKLLSTHIPSRNQWDRPVTLRSDDEQRRLAFRSFLQRTWFDYTLHHVERVLMVIMLVVFSSWVYQKYALDWLYDRGFLVREDLSLMEQPISFDVPLTAGDYWMATATEWRLVSDNVPALPFMDQGGHVATQLEYRAPQPVSIPPNHADKRPYRLRIPSQNLETAVKEVFVEDGAWQVASYAAGYHHGTALPGEIGNTVMAGHAGLHGSVFRNLGNLEAGDDVFVDAGGWQYHYQVRQLDRVWPTQTDVMAPTPTRILTLITCTDWDTRRLVVIADLVGSRPLEK